MYHAFEKMGQALAGAWWQQCPDCEQWRRRQNGETNKMVLTLHKNIKDVMMKSEGGEKRSVCVCWDGRPEVHHAQEAYCARGSLWRGLYPLSRCLHIVSFVSYMFVFFITCFIDVIVVKRCWRNWKSLTPPSWEDWEIPLTTAHCMAPSTAK